MKAKDYIFAVAAAAYLAVVITGRMMHRWHSALFFSITLGIGCLAVVLWVLLRMESAFAPESVPCASCGGMIRRAAKFCGSCGAPNPGKSPLTPVLDVIFFRWVK